MIKEEMIEFCKTNRRLDDFKILDVENVYYEICKMLIDGDLHVHNDGSISSSAYDPDFDIVEDL